MYLQILKSPGETNEFWEFYISMYEVLPWLNDRISDFLSVVFDDERWNFLFYFAFIPSCAMFVIDIVISFYLSVRYRELKIFNVISPKSWKNLRCSLDTRNYSSLSNKSFSLKNLFLNNKILSTRAFNKIKAGDSFRCRDGMRYSYCGLRMSQNSVLYSYRTKNSLIYSNLKPSLFAKSSYNTRVASVRYAYNKKNEGGAKNG